MEILSRWMIAGFVDETGAGRNYFMKVKFVYDGASGPRNEAEKEVVIEMKTLPHEGDRVRLIDGMFEIIRVTHTPDKGEVAAVAAIRPLSEP